MIKKIGTFKMLLRYTLGLLMLTIGIGTAWGDDGLSGTYYIGSRGYNASDMANNFYLCPTEGWAFYVATNNVQAADNGQPFLTTYKCKDGVYDKNKAIWKLQKHETEPNCYYIIQVKTNRYVISNGVLTGAGNTRARVHLEKVADPSSLDDKALFEITYDNGHYDIKPHSSDGKVEGFEFLVVNNNNKNQLDGEGSKTNGPTGFKNCGGIIGLYSHPDDGNAYFYLEEAVYPPTITVNASGDVEITSLEGTTIHYTTNGDTPTAGNTTYSGAITPTAEMTSIKAIAVNANNKVSEVVTLPLVDYTYYIVNNSHEIAVKKTVRQAVGKPLSGHSSIPADIASPYISDETITFYSFSGAYTSDQYDELTTEGNIISKTPEDKTNIYVTYELENLGAKFLKLRGARVFNIKDGSDWLFDNDGTLGRESTDDNKNTSNRMWKFNGSDPYAVKIQNNGSKRYLAFSTAPELTIGDQTTFILVGTSSNDENITLMTATGTGTPDYTTKNIKAYVVETAGVSYKIIDKSGKLLLNDDETILSYEPELKLPDEWISPLVSAYHFFKTAVDVESNGIYTPSTPITSPFEADGVIYVTYDVNNEIDLTGDKNYLLKYLYGESFKQENGSDGINGTETKAVYPYNNGDFQLYVYGQEQWDTQLSSGASTRTRWLWKFISRHNGVDLTGNDIDPYHVVVKSNQNQSIKIGDVSYAGSTYLRTYKPNNDVGVITGVSYENADYPNSKPSDLPTEYMIVGSSSSMMLKTVNPVDGERRIVDTFEQYWKNNPTVQGIAGANPVADNSTLTGKGWHRYEAWAFAADWNGDPKTKTLTPVNHWFQTIKMGIGDNAGKFTVEAVDLAPQVILLDQHGWEIMRVPMYNDFGKDTQTKNEASLSKYNSPMVKANGYHWYPSAVKATGYHKFTVSNQEIIVYDSDRKATANRYVHNSTSLADIPYDHLVDQDYRVKTDFYVTYDVTDEYAYAYTGAATAAETSASAYLLKQGGKYATAASNTEIGSTTTEPNLEAVDENMQWYVRPNFNIDKEMGYKYETKTKAETEAEYVAAGKNGFDPYNVQIQSVKYPQRYFTTSDSKSALEGGTWKTGEAFSVSLQGMKSRQAPAGYDQTKLNITNATFMVVGDANGNMRLMPRFDHDYVVNTFTTSDEATTAAEAVGNAGAGNLTLMLRIVPKPIEIHSSAEMTDMNGHYLLARDFKFASGFTSLGTESAPFKGTIDGQLNTIGSTVSVPFVAFAEGATIKNVILDNVDVSGAVTFNTSKKAIGALVAVAKGSTRIYNCGILATNSVVKPNSDGYTEITDCKSSVGGTADYVGGLVGFLDGEARVINCFSYANITAGTNVGGIVGWNTTATDSRSDKLKTMVMNCMFYGDIVGTGYTKKSPIYGGTTISNKDTNGVGNYNYFRLESSFVQPSGVDYNCALGAETRFLQRFEFYRHLLNSHLELAGWWATGTYSKEEMMKWVLEPSQIGTSTPYPILKAPGTYPSVVNIDAENAPSFSDDAETRKTQRNEGRNFGTLTVNIRMGKPESDPDVLFGPPTDAAITTSSLPLSITDKDFKHFNFNYYKVQLPYYNEVGTKNYTGNRVVTGWKIVSITGGTSGSFSAGVDAPAYNFADRQCTAKDDYSVSGRVFSQGAYWDVPEGVTAITIEPYWAKAAYVADSHADVVYDGTMSTAKNVPNVGGGQRYTDGNSYDIAGEQQKVYTSVSNAVTALSINNSYTVHDYAVVLVGNVHQYTKSGGIGGNNKYTVTTIDLDGDNEPDYSFMLRLDGRNAIHPLKWDFLNLVGLGMAQKSTGGTGSYNIGIPQPKGWFEVSNTSLFRVTQFEYDRSDRGAAPYIVQGGVMEQWVSGQNNGAANNTTYFLVGGNVWFKEFHRGTHQDKTLQSKHPPVSVTGGDYDEFYLTGLYTANVASYADNAECYINGGRFGTVVGAAQEGLGGNITWQIQNADIDEFYAGGLNADKPVTGNLTTVVDRGYIRLFCGGPKFGDMSSGKTVTTTATGTIFDTFFGAGYGGNSYSRQAPRNHNSVVNFPHNDKDAGNDDSWNAWLARFYKQEYNSTYGGVSTQFSYQFLPMSDNKTNVARIFVEYVKFSLATTRSVTSNLKDCTITGNFYGGGSLGKVAGNVTSTLEGCTVKGNVFGAGFSASLPTVEVDAIGFEEEPLYYESLGTYRIGTKYFDDPEYVHTQFKGDGSPYYEPTIYTWTQGAAGSNVSINKTAQTLSTPENLSNSNLGSVDGDVSLTLKGNTKVGTLEGGSLKAGTGNVFGGGESSYVTSVSAAHTVTVTLQGNTEVYGNVFGGGDQGNVQGSTTVNIE